MNGSSLAFVGLVAVAACAVVPQQVDLIGPVTDLARLPDGALVVCARSGLLVARDDHFVGVGATQHRSFAVALVAGDATSGRPARLLVGGGTPARDGVLWLQGRNGEAPIVHRVGRDVVYAVAASADGRLGAAACADGSVRLLRIDSPKDAPVERMRHAGPCRAVAFDASGAWLASGGRDGRVVLTATTIGDERRIECAGHTDGVECIVFRRDGTIASGARDGRVRVHDPSGRMLRSWLRLGAPVLALAEDGDDLIAGLADGRLLRLAADRERPVEVARVDGPVFALLTDRRPWQVGTTHRIVAVP